MVLPIAAYPFLPDSFFKTAESMFPELSTTYETAHRDSLRLFSNGSNARSRVERIQAVSADLYRGQVPV